MTTLDTAGATAATNHISHGLNDRELAILRGKLDSAMFGKLTDSQNTALYIKINHASTAMSKIADLLIQAMNGCAAPVWHQYMGLWSDLNGLLEDLNDAADLAWSIRTRATS